MAENIHIWSLSNTSWIVLLVLILLVISSVFSWVIIIQRGIMIHSAHQHMQVFEDKFWSGMDLTQLFQEIQNGEDIGGLAQIFKSGFSEFTRLRSHVTADADAIMEGTQRAIHVAISREQAKLETHLPLLASVGSTCPYVGLFGTVIGIMNSFQGMAANVQQTIASVAPGISEALITTAMGLFVAIPAVVGYNRYTTRVESLLANYETFSDEFYGILHRKVHSKNRVAS